MVVKFLVEAFSANSASEAVIWKDVSYSYSWLLERIVYWRSEIRARGLKPGTVVVMEADFSPNAIALFLALTESSAILVPLTSSVRAKREEFIGIAQGELAVTLDASDKAAFTELPGKPSSPLYEILRERKSPGLVLFSSGSTGKSKAAVHDLAGILEKFKVPRPRQRAISFLLFDHIGGINTMLHILSNGGCLVAVESRKPDDVLRAVEKHSVELLPTSPTFINLLLLSEAYSRHSLRSLKVISYGTEPMPESTLRRFHELFPDIKLAQTYGLSEVGILRAKSKSSESLYVKIGGEGFETRVVDGILHIKAKSAMLGYINAPSPFTPDGWMNTGDSVQVDGEYLRILGRKSELINVGGEKVYPAEVESVIQGLDNVADTVVYAEKNAITGNIICAKVKLLSEEDPRVFATRLKKHCLSQLQHFKVPVKITVVKEDLFTERVKKDRGSTR